MIRGFAARIWGIRFGGMSLVDRLGGASRLREMQPPRRREAPRQDEKKIH
jgi:hypothetical protein